VTGIRISEFAATSGIPASTLRYYEAVGLLRPERDANGYRRYRADALERVRFVDRAKQLGLRLDEIAELMALRQHGACRPTRDRLVTLLVGKLAETRESIAELSALESELADLHRRLGTEPAPESCGPGCGCPDQPLSIPPAPPIGCTLPANRTADRVSEWRDLVATANSSAPTTDGWRLRFAADPQLAGRVATLAAVEQHCCTFLAFRIDLHDGALDVEVSAAPAARALVADLFGAMPGRQPEKE
jgi:DNA-binding transcriptional MerR regulator